MGKKGGKGGDKFIQKGKGEKKMDGEMDLDLDDLDLDDLEGEMMDRLMKELDGEMGERLMKELDGEEGDKPEKKGSKGGDKFIQKGKGEKEMDGEMDLDLDDLEGEMMDRLMKELD